MFLKVKAYPKKCPRGLLPYLYQFLISFTYILPINYLSIIVFLTLVILQTCCFLTLKDFKLFMEYAPCYTLTLYVFFTNLICLMGYIKSVRIFIMLEHIGLTDSVITTNKIKNTLFKRTKRVYAFLGVLVFVTIITVCSNSYKPLEKSILIYYLKKKNYLNQSFSNFEYMVWIILLVCAIGLTFLSLLAPVYFTYILFHNKYSVLLLTDQVYVFRNTCKHFLEEKQSNAKAHHEIFILNGLRQIFQKHIAITRYNKVAVEGNQLLYALYLCNGILVALLAIFEWFSPDHLIPLSTITMTGFFYVICILSDAADEYTELSGLLTVALYDLDWYNWTVKCQKTYLILMTHFSRPMKVNFFLLVDINRETIKSTLKGLYPVINFFYSTNK